MKIKSLSDEIKQKEAITDRLIKKILYSKRLLVDHVDALEQCVQNKTAIGKDTIDAKVHRTVRQISSQEIFTARNTCVLLGCTALEHYITPRTLRLTLLPSMLLTSGFSAFFIVKSMFGFRNKIVESELEKLITSIDEFGNCIRRNMTYFNEIIIMKQHELIESRQIERAWDCITAAKEATEILYDATRKLESQYSIPAKFSQYYSPMEELRDCDYFKNNVTDYSPKHIKDFHNIFAYVQSQFLLRLALTIATKPSLSGINGELVKINCLIHQLVQEENNHFLNLALEQNKKKQMELESLNAAKVMQNRSGPVAVLQDSSLKLSACMVAVAGECQALDITLQRLTEKEAERKDNTKQLVEVANSMRAIENALSMCFDDFQRLILVYSKFLNGKLNPNDDGREKQDQKREETTDDEFPESFLRIEISQNNNDKNKEDDFYAYMFDEQQEAAEAKKHKEDKESLQNSEILNFEERITKGKFRPVLKQLKDRIDPIRQVMLEREREVLSAKGLNVDELFKKESEAAAPNNRTVTINKETAVDPSDSEGSDDLEYQRRTKILKDRDNFAEMRNFLAQKQAINIFKMEPPKPDRVCEEEVLESEC